MTDSATQSPSHLDVMVTLLALATAAFVFIVSEVMPVGLLPEISTDLGVSEGQTGWLLTLYAIVAGVSAIPLTAMTTHVRRDRLVKVTMAIFVLSQALAAIAPTYTSLVVSRVLCGLCHGIFWSVLAPVAVKITKDRDPGRATSFVFLGFAVALIVGLPLATWVGQAYGWRLAFGAVGGLGLVVLTSLWTTLPSLNGDDSSPLSARQLRHSFTPPLLALYGITLAIVLGHFVAYSYIAPLARHAGGFDGTTYGLLLAGYGVAGLAGILFARRILDSRPRFLMLIALGLLTLVLLTLGSFAQPTVVALAFVVWGAAFVPVPVMLQAAVLRVSPTPPDVASAAYVVTYQVGISTGAWIGGLLVDRSHIGAIPFVDLSFVLIALLGVVISPAVFPRPTGNGMARYN